MQRAQLKVLAKCRIREARTLIRSEEFGGAYYLAGFSVECAIKSCIAKQTLRYEFPDKQKAVDSYTHDPTSLIRVAGLTRDLNSECQHNRHFDANWSIVKEWKIESRYNISISRREALDLYSAIVNRKHGVLKWLRRYW